MNMDESFSILYQLHIITNEPTRHRASAALYSSTRVHTYQLPAVAVPPPPLATVATSAIPAARGATSAMQSISTGLVIHTYAQ